MDNNIEALDTILNEKRSVQILQSLKEKPQHIRSLHRTIGGSLSTIVERVNSLLDAGLIRETELSRRERCLELTKRGRVVADTIGWVGASSRRRNLNLDRPKKWILALLYALKEIRGSTRLEKLLFLLKEELGVAGEPFYDFRPYLFGPFSNKVMEDAKALRDMGVIDITPEPMEATYELSDALFIRKNYKLTPKGEKEAESCYNEVANDKQVREAIYTLRGYNSMPLSNLLNHVYAKFPQYSPPQEMP